MWCVGNEVPNQWDESGCKISKFLQDICHREDPTRPVTQGMDAPDAVVNNNMAAVMDVAGFNYRPFRYQVNYKKLPQQIILGSETASTVSSRGVYKFTKVPRTTWSIATGLICRKTILSSMRTFRIVSGNSYGQDLIIWASLLLIIRIGQAIAPCSVLSIWRVSPRIVTIYTVVIGTKAPRPCISCRIGHGRDVRAR